MLLGLPGTIGYDRHRKDPALVLHTFQMDDDQGTGWIGVYSAHCGIYHYCKAKCSCWFVFNPQRVLATEREIPKLTE